MSACNTLNRTAMFLSQLLLRVYYTLSDLEWLFSQDFIFPICTMGSYKLIAKHVQAYTLSVWFVCNPCNLSLPKTKCKIAWVTASLSH